MAQARPTVAEILADPSYHEAVWQLTPSQQGTLKVAKGRRGGPFGISWEVHGVGPIKLVWVTGLGAVKTTYRRLTKMFGHDQGDKYSVLIYDNRGMGKSDVPITRYSTSEMAMDAIELIDHLAWIGERQLHVMGVSMGGMIAQELAYLIPTRLSSLALVSTAARVENTTTYLENLRNRFSMFVPKTLDRTLRDGSLSLFSPAYLDHPDDADVPSSSTPCCRLPEGKSTYRKFRSNYERWAAAELVMRTQKGGFTRHGLLLQGVAAGWHCKSKEQLKEIGDKVGRERIMVLHGDKDQLLTVHHGRKLIEFLEPAIGVVRKGFGHVLMLEDAAWHNEMLFKIIEKGESLDRPGN